MIKGPLTPADVLAASFEGRDKRYSLAYSR